jgi:hypothetical protein
MGRENATKINARMAPAGSPMGRVKQMQEWPRRGLLWVESNKCKNLAPDGVTYG